MTKKGFRELQQSAAASGKPMTQFLRERGIAYSMYNYWRKRYEREMASPMMAPITVMRAEPSGHGIVCGGESPFPSGVTLAFPNGLRAHLDNLGYARPFASKLAWLSLARDFGHGSERVLMEVLERSLPDHVLPSELNVLHSLAPVSLVRLRNEIQNLGPKRK